MSDRWFPCVVPRDLAKLRPVIRTSRRIKLTFTLGKRSRMKQLLHETMVAAFIFIYFFHDVLKQLLLLLLQLLIVSFLFNISIMEINKTYKYKLGIG